jgi:phosphoribosylamine--glycine ligase
MQLPGNTEEDRWIIHAGTRQTSDGLVTAGGRVLGAVGLGLDLAQARSAAYALLEETHFNGLTFRRDIAAQGG